MQRYVGWLSGSLVVKVPFCAFFPSESDKSGMPWLPRRVKCPALLTSHHFFAYAMRLWRRWLLGISKLLGGSWWPSFVGDHQAFRMIFHLKMDCPHQFLSRIGLVQATSSLPMFLPCWWVDLHFISKQCPHLAQWPSLRWLSWEWWESNDCWDLHL